MIIFTQNRRYLAVPRPNFPLARRFEWIPGLHQHGINYRDGDEPLTGHIIFYRRNKQKKIYNISFKFFLESVDENFIK